jgi:predicted component of type VI protein secretion system
MVTDGPACGHELHLEVLGRPYRIGRASGCNLAVADDDLSREHAEFERRWDGVFVRDLHSKNGVLCQGERLTAEQRLSDGDVLRLGQTTLRLDDPEDRYLRQMEEAEARVGQAAKSGTALAVSSDRADPLLADTHTSSGQKSGTRAVRGGAEQRMSTKRAGSSPAAAPQSGRPGRRVSRHGPLAFMIVAALVLVGTIVLALSFILGS